MSRLTGSIPKWMLVILAVFIVAGCATVVSLKLDDRFGLPDPGRFDRLPVAANGTSPDYWKDVRPILDQRCVTCHACYDAPCQLNLGSYAGMTRGANPLTVYSSSRLVADPPTRLGIDAQSTVDWRARGFFPVLNERQPTLQGNREAGAMVRLLQMKQANPGPNTGPLNDPDLDFSLDRSQQCVRVEGLDEYARRHPGWGMPFALPALSADEHKTLTDWLVAGAPYTPRPPLSSAGQALLAEWEIFLNQSSKRGQLVARYIYEHWFVGHLYFDALPGEFFQLVRSRTPPGKLVDMVATRRPYDDPGVERVYYRLQRVEATAVAKTHMPLKLDKARMARLQGWFFAADYPVDVLPGYAPEVASNPFLTFHALPVDARYRFMLDDAQFTLMGFMKGPVCRGQVALNVINDYFLVIFVSPDSRESAMMGDMLDKAMPNLRMPAEHESTTGLLAWRNYSKLESNYLAAKSNVLRQSYSADFRPSIKNLWDGDGKNPNAGLTVFRHFDSASVVRGLAGEQPQTTLLLGYPLFERMHYLLLAGFDVFGNVGHQLATRLYMDFLRMEGEMNFLTLLPLNDRQPILDHWYRGRKEQQIAYLADAAAYFSKETGVRYRTDDHLGELYRMLQGRLAPVREPLARQKLDARWRAESAQLRRLSSLRGMPASIMPENSLLAIHESDGSLRLASLIRNSAHTNVAQLFDEADRRLPEEDTLLALEGVVGAYPNAFFTVDAVELPNFIDTVSTLANEADLVRLVERFGVRRTDLRFWSLSDSVHAEWRRIAPHEAAILDYSRLENR